MSAGYLQLIELALAFGGVLVFGWWQLRSVERDRRARIDAEQRAGRMSGNDGSNDRVAEKSD